jgi:hypothetical protein
VGVGGGLPDLAQAQAPGNGAAGGVGQVVHDLQVLHVWQCERLGGKGGCHAGGQALACGGRVQPVALRPWMPWVAGRL